MAQTFIPGWQVELGVGNPNQDLTVIGNVLQFARQRTSLPKPVFGVPFRHEIPGQASGSLAFSGHLSAEMVQPLQELFGSGANGSVPYEIQIGVVGSATDGGKYTGLVSITDYTIDVDAEDEWVWSMSGTMDGVPAYTPAA